MTESGDVGRGLGAGGEVGLRLAELVGDRCTRGGLGPARMRLLSGVKPAEMTPRHRPVQCRCFVASVPRDRQIVAASRV